MGNEVIPPAWPPNPLLPPAWPPNPLLPPAVDAEPVVPPWQCPGRLVIADNPAPVKIDQQYPRPPSAPGLYTLTAIAWDGDRVPWVLVTPPR